jgi:peroxiredoxin
MKAADARRWIAFSMASLILGAIWMWFSAVPAGATTGGKIPAPQQGFLAPDFTLSTPEGEAYSLSDLRGQAVLINLWASWCRPCRAEMPAMQRIYEEYHSFGFEILAVNVTNQDSIPAAVAFAEEYGLEFPILLDLDGVVSRDYLLRALPSSFFVNRDGVIEEVVIGGPMAEALLRIRVEQLIGAAQ